MRYQIGYSWRGHRERGTFIYVEPSTYYPSKKVAEQDIPRIESQVPALKGVLEVKALEKG